MIYKLYVNVAGWSKLDVSFDKKDIVDTMAWDNKKTKHDYYMIVEEEKDRPPEWTILRNQETIDEYIKVFNEIQRLENMSVMELKKYMVKKRS